MRESDTLIDTVRFVLFDDAAFAVDFNDVDLCLRLNAAGYRTLMAPEAVLDTLERQSND